MVTWAYHLIGIIRGDRVSTFWTLGRLRQATQRHLKQKPSTYFETFHWNILFENENFECLRNVGFFRKNNSPDTPPLPPNILFALECFQSKKNGFKPKKSQKMLETTIMTSEMFHICFVSLLKSVYWVDMILKLKQVVFCSSKGIFPQGGAHGDKPQVSGGRHEALRFKH